MCGGKWETRRRGLEPISRAVRDEEEEEEEEEDGRALSFLRYPARLVLPPLSPPMVMPPLPVVASITPSPTRMISGHVMWKRPKSERTPEREEERAPMSDRMSRKRCVRRITRTKK